METTLLGLRMILAVGKKAYLLDIIMASARWRGWGW